MSSFEAPKPAHSGPRVAALGKRPSLMHRSSDPEFSDAELDDAVIMGENAVWANLVEPIYVEKDVEIFRPTLKDSSLPVYYAKGWLPFSADTLFDALMDARYRKSWDKNVHQVHVVEHQHVSDVLYFALNLPWPLANRDYVYRRRVKFYPDQTAFVVLCQAAHHANAPSNDVRVRVETCSLRLCIRGVSSSNNACDFHLEYEDDTNFSIPNYVVNMLLHTMMPSFMTELRKACSGYADYIKTLDDNGVQSIPSQVVRHRMTGSVSSVGSKSAIGASVTEERKPTRTSPRPRSSLFFRSKRPKRKPGLVRRETDEHSSMSDDWDADEAPRILDDDFAVTFHKQKIGLHLETDLFSNKVLVAFCEKESEAAGCREHIEPGFLVTSVNGVSVSDFNFTDILDRESSLQYRRFKEPHNVLRCLVSRDENDLLCALRPLDEDAAPGPERVLVPAGYLVYEINDSGDACVVTFKAAMAVVGGNKRRSLKGRHKISRRLSGVFRRKRRVSDASITATQATDANADACGLKDYSSVVVTAENMDWVWQQVQLLKATERIFSAALLIDRLEAFLSDTGSASKIIAAAKTRVLRAMHDELELLEHIKERRDQGVKALKEFSDKEGDDEWQFGQTMLGVTTSWKPDEDGSVWIKLEGLVDGVDIFNTISVIREVDLYSVWTPFCAQSLLLQSMGHVELAAYLAISSPFLQRDAIIRAFGINAVYENRCLLLLGGSVDVSSVASSVPVPTLQGWSAGRMEIKGFRALIEPLTRMQARACIVANIDPKCAIPKPMLNFGIKKMAGILLYLIRKEAEKIEHDLNKPGFYTWLRPIVDKYFVDQRNGDLPEPLSLTTDTSSEWTTDADAPRSSGSKNTRTGSPRLAKRRSSTRIAAFQRHAIPPTSSSKYYWSDYLHDFTIWPYLLLFIFAKTSAGLPLLYACLLKFVFTCTCTWLAVPGAFPRATRQWKRARNDLEPLRRQCVVLAAICDVLSSYALRVWARWVQCYLSALMHGSAATVICFSRSPSEVRESEQFALLAFCFLYASAIVGVQIAVNI
uniref:Phosphatidylcholine transfer protein n=1 Tax=Phytophthora ramorum TaxID=164328 RepID=H3HCW7_PHYRM